MIIELDQHVKRVGHVSFPFPFHLQRSLHGNLMIHHTVLTNFKIYFKSCLMSVYNLSIMTYPALTTILVCHYCWYSPLAEMVVD